ncbi:MAG: hypothetical protein PSX81_04375 [bacterium]|nr:hypothetical protein [bacterium]
MNLNFGKLFNTEYQLFNIKKIVLDLFTFVFQLYSTSFVLIKLYNNIKKINFKIAILTLTIALFANSAFSNRTLVVSRLKSGCFPGCNTADRTVEIVEYTYANGRTEIIDQVSINCSGVGTSSCPTSMVRPNDPPVSPAFDATCGNAQFQYALTQISGSVITGTHYDDYVNVTSGETWRFTVEWSTVSGLETINVYKESISW